MTPAVAVVAMMGMVCLLSGIGLTLTYCGEGQRAGRYRPRPPWRGRGRRAVRTGVARA